MSNVRNLLRGKPVLTMLRGWYPNKADILSIGERFPNHVVRTEPAFNPCRFVVTVSRK